MIKVPVKIKMLETLSNLARAADQSLEKTLIYNTKLRAIAKHKITEIILLVRVVRVRWRKLSIG
jgi:hypothetical protein